MSAAYGGGPDPSVLDVFVAARRFQAATWAVLLGHAQDDQRQAECYLGWLRSAARQTLDG